MNAAFAWAMLAIWAASFLGHLRDATPSGRAASAVRAALIVWCALVLAGCGGGNTEPDKTTQPVVCRTHPEACK